MVHLSILEVAVTFEPLEFYILKSVLSVKGATPFPFDIKIITKVQISYFKWIKCALEVINPGKWTYPLCINVYNDGKHCSTKTVHSSWMLLIILCICYGLSVCVPPPHIHMSKT